MTADGFSVGEHILWATPSMDEEAAAALRAPFPPEAVGKLPRAGITLDFVGHADVTDRLLQVDPCWTWEPVAYAEDGAPLIRDDGKVATLWIRLTVCGVTRLGVGNEVSGKFDLEKLLISDALRNAAMRFGVALDLWRRGELDDRPGQRGEVQAPTTRRQPAPMPGFESLKAQQKAHDAYAELARTASEPIREAMKRWRADEKLPYPMGADDLARAREVLESAIEQASGAGEPDVRHGGDDDTGTPNRESVDAASPAPVSDVGGDGATREGPIAVETTRGAPAVLDLEGTSPPAGYETWSKADLADECEALGLPHAQNKDRLVAELRAYDSLHPEHSPYDVAYQARPF